MTSIINARRYMVHKAEICAVSCGTQLKFHRGNTKTFRLRSPAVRSRIENGVVGFTQFSAMKPLKVSVPSYTCEKLNCVQPAKFRSRCPCQKFYCSDEHLIDEHESQDEDCFSGSNKNNHKFNGCPITSQSSSGHWRSQLGPEEPILVLPTISEDSESFCCINCGAALQKLDALCLICQWPACSNGCDPCHDVKVHHTVMECLLLRSARVKGYRWDCDPLKYWCIYLIRLALLRCRNPELFRRIVRKVNIHGIQCSSPVPAQLLKIVEMTKLYMPLVKGLLDNVDFFKLYTVVRLRFRPAVPPTTGRHLIGLYPEGSVIPHSCLPNSTFVVSTSSTMYLKPLHPKQSGSTDTPTVTWDDFVLLLPRHLRKQRLNEKFGLFCSCIRCEDQSECGTYFSSLMCLQCKTKGQTGYLVQGQKSNSVVCSNCSELFDTSVVQRVEEGFKIDLARSWDSLQYLKIKLDQVGRRGQPRTKPEPVGVIHDRHYLYFQASWRLMELAWNELSVKQLEFHDFVPYAKTVIELCGIFALFEIEQPSIPLRLSSFILLREMTDSMADGLMRNLVQIEEEFNRAYFWKNRDMSFDKLSQDGDLCISTVRSNNGLRDLESKCLVRFKQLVQNLVKSKSVRRMFIAEFIDGW